VLIGDRADPDSSQSAYRMAHGFAHAANLPVAPLVDHHRENRVGAAGSFDHLVQIDRCGCCSLAVERNAFPQLLDGAVVGNAPYSNVILAAEAVTRVSQLLGKRAITRQEQQSLRVVVQPSDRIHVFTHAAGGEQVDDRGAPLGIGSRRDVAARFIEQDVAPPRRCLDPSSVDSDIVGVRICLGTEFVHRLAVHRDPSLSDQGLGRAPRREAGGGKDFLQPDGSHVSGSVRR